MTGKKSEKGYISPICGEAPTEAMYMKICLVGDVLDVITCAKFQNEILHIFISSSRQQYNNNKIIKQNKR